MTAARGLAAAEPHTAALFDFVNAATGLYPGIDEHTYHSRTLGVANKSALDAIDRSPAHYRAMIDQPRDEEDVSDVLVIGKAFHCRVLEPHAFGARYVAAPNFGDLRFKENKQKRDAWKTENAGKTPLDPAVMAALEGMAAAVHAHPKARAMFEAEGVAEMTARWEDLETGIICKARSDWFVPSLGLIVDLKSTEDARPDPFAKSVAKYRYHVQHAHYVDGFALAGAEVEDFVFVAVEKKPPFACAVYVLDADAVRRGNADAQRNLRTLAECIERDEWPAYGTEIEPLSLPRWA